MLVPSPLPLVAVTMMTQGPLPSQSTLNPFTVIIATVINRFYYTARLNAAE